MHLGILAVQLQTIDWAIVAAFLVLTLLIGVVVSRRAGQNTSEFFLSGRTMPWWLLGFSMVATTFSTDTPNLVTDFVRQKGVANNWQWWALLLTGMLTVFVYARLWRRSGVTTDVEFYELRYSGAPAAFLRGFRALYLGFFFNVLIMATVSIAAIKIGGVMLGFSPVQSVVAAALVTVIFSSAGGFRGVLLTDFVLFIVAMIGSVAAAYVAVTHPDVGGLTAMLDHPNLQGKMSVLPDFSDRDLVISVLVIPLAVQWWSVWYPGAEPGGGGYIAQRMLAAKNETHAVGATFFFNAAHYALRPWPWILVALASMIVFPDVADIRKAFPHLPDDVPLKDDLAYPAMLTFLPPGLLGLVIASLLAAYMSTISTHLNWGSSYIVNDFWKRFVNPNAGERELVFVGRVSTVLMMVIAGIFSLMLENAVQGFGIMLQIGAGTGLIFILRWFWWRINAFSELTAMIVSFLVALYFHFKLPGSEELSDGGKIVTGVAITTVAWVTATFITPPTDEGRLRAFYRLVKPGGPGWAAVIARAAAEGEDLNEGQAGWTVPLGIVCMLTGCVAIYSALFATGQWIYGQYAAATTLTVIAIVSSVGLFALWKRMHAAEKAIAEKVA